MNKKIIGIGCVALVLNGCGSKIDCGSDEFKNLFLGRLMAAMGDAAPNLEMAIEDKKVRASLTDILEISKNKDSNNVQCQAKLTVTFDDEDFEKAKDITLNPLLVMMASNFTNLPNSNVMNLVFKYSLGINQDKSSKDKLVMSIDAKSERDIDKNLDPYITVYDLLSLKLPDYVDGYVNPNPWSSEYKSKWTQACISSILNNTVNCSCVSSALESKIPMRDMKIIDHIATKNKSSVGYFDARFPKYLDIIEAAKEKCKK